MRKLLKFLCIKAWHMTLRNVRSNNKPGCGAVGSARRLGARHRPLIMKSRKTLKTLVNTDFFGTLFSCKILNNCGLTTCLTTYGKTEKNQYFTYFGM